MIKVTEKLPVILAPLKDVVLVGHRFHYHQKNPEWCTSFVAAVAPEPVGSRQNTKRSEQTKAHYPDNRDELGTCSRKIQPMQCNYMYYDQIDQGCPNDFVFELILLAFVTNLSLVTSHRFGAHVVQ